jgi:hypothetical protein
MTWSSLAKLYQEDVSHDRLISHLQEGAMMLSIQQYHHPHSVSILRLFYQHCQQVARAFLSSPGSSCIQPVEIEMLAFIAESYVHHAEYPALLNLIYSDLPLYVLHCLAYQVAEDVLEEKIASFVSKLLKVLEGRDLHQKEAETAQVNSVAGCNHVMLCDVILWDV